VTTVERALHVLIHDVRTPVGVAQGYLRMLLEDRLPTPEARVRAIAQAQQALDDVSRLCHDAAALADGESAETSRRVLVPCARFVGRVRERLEREPVVVSSADGGPHEAMAVAVPGDAEGLADAVTRVLLASAGRPGQARAVAIGVTAEELWFTSGRDQQTLSGAALDCWRGRGFSLPLACRMIAGAGGRVWAAGPDHTGTGVAFPLEVAE
jgi:signal transduction histidine kinase